MSNKGLSSLSLEDVAQAARMHGSFILLKYISFMSHMSRIILSEKVVKQFRSELARDSILPRIVAGSFVVGGKH
jgi:hypothetical protein